MSPKFYALHGNLGGPEDWAAVETASGLRFEKLDLWRWVLPYEDWAQAVIPQLEPGSVLVGYSLGARLAMHLLTAFPGHFRSAVLISGHPGLGHAAEREQRVKADAVWAEKARTLPWATFLAEWNAQLVFQGATALARSESLREAVAKAFDVWSLGKQADLTASLRDPQKMPVKTFWLTGRADAKFSQIGQSLCQGTAHLEHVTMEGGHRLPWDAASEIGKLLH